jgi:hypothetical protein
MDGCERQFHLCRGSIWDQSARQEADRSGGPNSRMAFPIDREIPTCLIVAFRL